MNKIGIRHEDKYNLERRTPLVPEDVIDLVQNHQIEIFVESSSKRVFSDQEFQNAGASIVNNMKNCDVILGVKEMPETYFEPGKVYLYFSHVIKGQPSNMPMLRNLMKAGSTLIDYEKITDEKGSRLIFFGRHAGLAGMINTLWATGQRYKELGVENPFSELKQVFRYHSLAEAKTAIKRVSELIQEKGLPEPMKPLVFAVTGDGNVSQGALEILNLLEGKKIKPQQLKNKDYPTDADILTTNILPEDYLKNTEGREFDLYHYFEFPEQYRSEIEEFLPDINVFVNGIYWDERYPKLIKKSWLKKQAEANQLNLEVIGDITCDVHGSIECTEKATEIEDPVFVYHPETDSFKMGFEGDGIAVMAVDILPSELPRESSEHFSAALKPFIKPLADADFSVGFEELNLPEDLKRATIVHKGELMDNYKYLRKFIGEL